MKDLKFYWLRSTSVRTIGGYTEGLHEAEFKFGFPIDALGCDTLVIEEPYLEAEYGGEVESDAESAAFFLDKMVNSGMAISVIYNPAPNENGPRLTIDAPDLKVQVRVF